MLREPRQAAAKQSVLSLKRVHNDPDLFRTPGACFIFLHHLWQSGMLRWERAWRRKGALGVFFVKEDSRLRIIFDTRMLNTHFVDPPKTALPSAVRWPPLGPLPVLTSTGDRPISRMPSIAWASH